MMDAARPLFWRARSAWPSKTLARDPQGWYLQCRKDAYDFLGRRGNSPSRRRDLSATAPKSNAAYKHWRCDAAAKERGSLRAKTHPEFADK